MRYLFGLLITLLAMELAVAKTYRVAGDYNVDMPPFFWRERCTNQPAGYGWELQRKLWADLGITAEAVHVNIIEIGGIDAFYQRVTNGDYDVFLGLTATDNVFVKTTDEPSFYFEGAVYRKIDSNWEYNNWKSLIGKRVGMIMPHGIDLRSADFRAFTEQSVDFRPITDYVKGFMLLNQGKLDYLVTYRAIGSAIITHYGFESIIADPIENVEESQYYAIAKNSPLFGRSSDIDNLLRHYYRVGLNRLLMRSAMERWLKEQSGGDCEKPGPQSGVESRQS